MKTTLLFLASLLILPLLNTRAADPPPVVGLCIAAPQQIGAGSFLKQYYSEEPGASETGQVGSLNQIMKYYSAE